VTNVKWHPKSTALVFVNEEKDRDGRFEPTRMFACTRSSAYCVDPGSSRSSRDMRANSFSPKHTHHITLHTFDLLLGFGAGGDRDEAVAGRTGTTGAGVAVAAGASG
jgi:hypothetical protein